MFDLTIVCARKIIYDEAVESVRVNGDESEYEFREYHAKCIGLLRKGMVLVNNRLAIPIMRGVVRFENNKCLILAEEMPGAEERDKARKRRHVKQ